MGAMNGKTLIIPPGIFEEFFHCEEYRVLALEMFEVSITCMSVEQNIIEDTHNPTVANSILTLSDQVFYVMNEILLQLFQVVFMIIFLSYKMVRKLILITPVIWPE